MVAAAIPADYAAPQIVEKPLLVTPGEATTLTIYNGGHEVWADLYVSVANGPLVQVPGVLGPEETAHVTIDAPLALLMDATSIPVSLWYDGSVIDARSLPVRVDAPAQALFIDKDAVGGPEFVLMIDPRGRSLGTVQVEVAIEQEGKAKYLEFFGPFSTGNDVIVYRSPVPADFANGEYDLHATFYAGKDVFAETSEPVSFAKSRPSFAPLLVILLTMVFILVLYLVIDMCYNHRSLRESWQHLR